MFRVICLLGMIFLSGRTLCLGDTQSPEVKDEVDSLGMETLLDMDLEELMGLEVTVASKKPESQWEAPGVVTVVSQEEMMIYGDRTLYQVLERQPSTYAQRSFTYGHNMVSFRGDLSTQAETHTLILLNGRPIRESAQGMNVNMYETMPLSGLESVEIIRGPGSVLYGSNAFTGVVNLRTKAVPEQKELKVSTQAGSFGYYDTTVSGGGRVGDLGLTASAKISGQQGAPYRMIDQSGTYGEDDESDKGYAGLAHLDYHGLTFDVFASDYKSFSLGILPLWSNPNSIFRNKKLFLNTGYRYDFTDQVSMELNATYNRQENSLSSTTDLMIGTNTSDFIGEATLMINPWENLGVVLGFLQESRKNYSPDHGQFESIPAYDYEPRSAYAQADYQVNKALTLIGGAQWNESSQGDSDVVSRIGAIVTPGEHWGLKLLRGEAFRAPVTLESDLYDPSGLVGNPNLEPELITTYDAQLFVHDERTHAAVTYFHSTIDQLIIYDTSVFPISYMNGGEQVFEGVEFEIKHFINAQWHILGSFLHQENKADDGLNPTVVPDHMAKIGTGYTWQLGSASLFYTYYSAPPLIYIPGTTSYYNPNPKPVHLISANLRCDLATWSLAPEGRAIATLRVENLLDQDRTIPTLAYTGSPNSFPGGAGITWYAGMELNF